MKPFHPLNLTMKRVSLRKALAPTPRLTPWVPAALALLLVALWLGLLVLIGS